MMKNIAILLFSALAITGCATDDAGPDEIDTVLIDKPGQDTKQIDVLEPAVKAWAEQFVNEPRPIVHGALTEWAEEIILADRHYTILHGKDADRLLDGRGATVVTIPCHVCDRGF